MGWYLRIAKTLVSTDKRNNKDWREEIITLYLEPLYYIYYSERQLPSLLFEKFTDAAFYPVISRQAVTLRRKPDYRKYIMVLLTFFITECVANKGSAATRGRLTAIFNLSI